MFNKKNKALSAIPVVVILMLCGVTAGIISYNVAMDVEYEAEMGTYEAYETLTGDSIGREPPKNVVGGVGGSISPGQVRPAVPEEEFPDDDSTAVYSINYTVYCEKADEYYFFKNGRDTVYSFTTKNLEGISWYDMLSDDSWHSDLDMAFSERTPLLYIEGSGGTIVKEIHYYVSDTDEVLSFEPKSTTLKQTVPWNHRYSAGEYNEYWTDVFFIVDAVKAPVDEPPALIPEGGRYEAANGDVYGPGNEFPVAPEYGDSYYYGDYEYRYNHNYRTYGGWRGNYEQNGWGVRVLDRNKTSYGPLLSEIAGKPLVTATELFRYCRNLEKAPELPGTLKTIYQAFAQCSSLTEFPEIPMSVTNIGGAFSGTSFSSIPSLAHLTNITDAIGAFSDCQNLIISPELPDSIEDASSIYSSCYNLTTVTNIPKGAIALDYAFNGCKALTNVPAVPSNVETMCRTFARCELLEEVIIETDKVQYLLSTFSECTSLKKISKLPQNLENMESTFWKCPSLESIPELPSKLQSMSYTFRDCTSLKNVPAIPSGVSNLTGAFQNCTSLSGQITINAGGVDNDVLKYFNYCFAGTTQPIHLLGACKQATKASLAATSSAGNITY